MADAAATFVGRERELQVLEDAWSGPRGAFIPVYGRRRVGKSALLLEWLGKKPGIYQVGKVAPAELQIRELLEAAAQALKQPLLATAPARGWKEAFELIEQSWTKAERLVLVLDEFQWMVSASPELPSVLQELWDRRWKTSKRLMLVLCGSFIGFMEREVLGSKSPLFGRRTAQIHLKPFGWGEAARFHPGYSLQARAEAYFICGGIPQYLETFDSSRSIRANIEANLLHEFAPLYREPEFLLREELREVEKYHAVLYAIAEGHYTQKEIAEATALPLRSLHYWLEQLVQLGYVARRHPLTGGPVKQRAVRFVLEDPLLRFWFRFVFPHRSAVARLGPSAAYLELIKPQLEGYFGLCFERLCREALPWLWASEKVTADAQVGEYWDKAVQLDVVGARSDGVIDLGECKWGAVGSPKALRDELERKVLAYPNPKNATLVRRLFVREARSPRDDGAKWYDLESLYALAQRAAAR
ncbi:MAG: ATP-binding protein [Myxococcaceae bacterium]|nr:ATP-binding protein [Myxococcaceae bacterium]